MSKYKGVSLYHAIVIKDKELGLAGATVFRGIEGFGANSRIRTARILELSNDLPLVVDIIDSVEYIEKLMPFLDEAVQEGLITIEDVEVNKYTYKTKK
jgi:PII-like signaling protein